MLASDTSSAIVDPSASSDESPLTPLGWKEKTLWLVTFAVLTAIRIPGIWRGRFWAEEGRVFFQTAWEQPWYKALWISHAGYLNFIGNLAGVIANLVPLEKACYVSIVLSLIVQTFPLILLCLSRQDWLQDRKYLVAAFLLIVSMPMCQEIWLTSTCSQHHLTLCVAIILALEAGSGFARYFQYGLLLLAPLSGPASVTLLPLFILRAVLDKSRARAVQCLFLAAGAGAQLLLFWKPAGRVVSGLAPQPTFGIDPQLLLNIIFVKHIICPFLGFQESVDAAQGFCKAYQQGQLNMLPGILAALAACSTLAFAVSRLKRPEPRWFLTGGVMLAIIGYAGALGTRSESLMIACNERYAYQPQVLFELTMLMLAFLTVGRVRFIWHGIIVWLLVIGLHEFFLTPICFAEGPAWRSEVRAWRQDPHHKLRIWPDGWFVTLNGRL